MRWRLAKGGPYFLACCDCLTGCVFPKCSTCTCIVMRSRSKHGQPVAALSAAVQLPGFREGSDDAWGRQTGSGLHSTGRILLNAWRCVGHQLAGRSCGRNVCVVIYQCHCQMISTCHLGSKQLKAQRFSFNLAASSAPALFDLMGCIMSSQLSPVAPSCLQVDVRGAQAVPLQPGGMCRGCHAAQGALRQPSCHGNMVCRRACR
jgi:hypothetical protein